MTRIDGVPTAHASEAQGRPGEEGIRRHLEKVLASPAFHASKRCQKFLAYVCDKSLAGETQALKERVIATEVYGRTPDADLGEDTIVRVGAREVRKRLAQYYVSEEGASSEMRIELPPGSYAVEFRPVRLQGADNGAERTGGRRWRGWGQPRKRWAVAAAGLIALGAAAAGLGRRGAGETEFEAFWRPVMQDRGPLLIAVAHPLVYHASLRAMKLNEQRHPDWPLSEQRPIALAPRELDGGDLVPVFNQYVGFGDLVATTDVVRMLARRNKDVRVRMASGIEFRELRQTPTLLVGAITNRWTMELEKSWRFRFVRTDGFVNMIVDTSRAGPERQAWRIPTREDGSSPEDYMLVCRVRSAYTGAPVLVVAGLKQFGTEAAGAVLADPERLGAMLRRLPVGWETKNLQLVLHSRVIGNSATEPELVAWDVRTPMSAGK
jgi:hypothetical protein